jgi:peptidoglycan/xylan/chitin deacetylase (PgdA/CDA1 family)
MTLYIAAYDTELPGCLAACRKIVAAHRRYDMPATFFITGETLEHNPAEYREILDDPLFEVASHTYSHRMLRNHPLCGPAPAEPEVRREIVLGKEIVERVFKRPCLGLRPGCSFVEGLVGAPRVLQMVKEAGFRYVSSQAWGPDYSLPAPLNTPFTYAEDGFPELWELPCHGWHENLLKDNNRWGPRRLVAFPPTMPEAIPSHFLEKPEEEFAINRVFIDRAVERGLPHVSLIWHPWSLDAFDPAMLMLDLTFQYVRDRGLAVGAYADLAERCARGAGSPT